MDKLCHLESRIEDLFGSLKSELSCPRHELNQEIEKEQLTVSDMETSLTCRAKAKIALQESQINLLNTKLSEEQNKIIALENYSR